MTSKSNHLRFLLITICISLFICNAAIAKDNTSESDEKLLVRSNWAFSMDLYSKLSSTKENVFFSPYSISTGLAMTYAGAREQTEKQMAKVLHFNMKQKNLHAAFKQTRNELIEIGKKGQVELSIANALWMQQDHSFKKSYLGLISNNYGGGLNRVDFEKAPEDAGKKINSWVQQETKSKIQNLIQPGTLTTDSKLILTNAIYFKGSWQRPFKKENTKDDKFRLSAKDKINVPFMFQQSKIYYMENERLQAVILPYRGDDVSMMIVLPKKIDGASEVERSLSADVFSSWMPLFQITNTKVFLPKFKINYEAHLAKPLIAMGMTNAFDDTSADFSGIDGTKDLFISDVIHKAIIDVNEEGTEAAAATAVKKAKKASKRMPEDPKEFRADHPFLFLIQEARTGSILFMGRVNNPQQLK